MLRQHLILQARSILITWLTFTDTLCHANDGQLSAVKHNEQHTRHSLWYLGNGRSRFSEIGDHSGAPGDRVDLPQSEWNDLPYLR